MKIYSIFFQLKYIVIFCFFSIFVILFFLLKNEEKYVDIKFHDKNGMVSERFLINKEYRPFVGDDSFEVYFDYKSMSPAYGYRVFGAVVKVVVSSVSDEYMRSFGFQKSVAKSSLYRHVGKNKAFDIFEYKISPGDVNFSHVYLFYDKNKYPVVINIYTTDFPVNRVYRKLHDNVEVDYFFGKEIGEDDFVSLDASVVMFINSFLSN